ncbi:pro-resilin-like [Hyposmocoma kahamanoa]|uniref:pro-resilin-like n=1 Tax=Hyposmocoma kahamanoa TaxID=1477025 RepID=UPI000E6D8CAF|nr:pro-resilin-like [Hyposmocoma kahamanoa]
MVYVKILSVALLASLVTCEPPVPQGYNYRRPQAFSPPSPSYSAPSTAYGPPTNSYLPPSSGQNYQSGFGHTGQYNGFGQGNNGHYDDGHNHGHGGHGHDSEVPKAYEFGYSVKDAQSGNDYDRHETSDGNVVKGEYRVQLPDGRTQIVTYHADWKTGFHADVRYEGEARYPEPIQNNYQGGYNYNTPTDYQGSLTGFQGRPSTSYGPPGYH